MPNWLLWALMAGIFLALVLIQVLVKSKKPVRKAAGGVLMGLAALACVNLTGMFTGVTLPVSFLSLGVSAVGGIPGVTMLLLLNLIV